MTRNYPPSAWVITLILLAVVPIVAAWLDEPFYLEVFRRVLILSIAVASLDLLVGYGGMISLGHAAYLGLGSYAVGILGYYEIYNGPAQFALAIGGSAVFALIVGLVSLRVRGAYFIMITLAFAQLIYFLFISLQTYGGDDGMILSQRSQFAGLDLYDDTTLYYLAFGLLLAVLWLLHRLVHSRFGRVLDGIRQNERRMAAIGVHVYRYQLAAFVIAGMLCGLAGALMANHDEFISPAAMHWSRSGDLLVMAIVGGTGTLLGAVWGTALYILLEILLSGYSKHWHLVFGPCLVVLALATHRGLLDLHPGTWRKARRPASVSPTPSEAK